MATAARRPAAAQQELAAAEQQRAAAQAHAQELNTLLEQRRSGVRVLKPMDGTRHPSQLRYEARQQQAAAAADGEKAALEQAPLNRAQVAPAAAAGVRLAPTQAAAAAGSRRAGQSSQEANLRTGLARFRFPRDDHRSESDESSWGEDSSEPQASREHKVGGWAGGWAGGCP